MKSPTTTFTLAFPPKGLKIWLSQFFSKSLDRVSSVDRAMENLSAIQNTYKYASQSVTPSIMLNG